MNIWPHIDLGIIRDCQRSQEVEECDHYCILYQHIKAFTKAATKRAFCSLYGLTAHQATDYTGDKGRCRPAESPEREGGQLGSEMEQCRYILFI